MKKILITILTLVSLVSYGQKIPCVKHTLYSDIWSQECGDNGIQRLLPKNHKGFSLDTDYIENNIDERKVESYLLVSLNFKGSVIISGKSKMLNLLSSKRFSSLFRGSIGR